MNDRQVTNWLLAGILLVLVLQFLGKLDSSVEAETLRLDYCITEKISETPQQYLHVVEHSSEK